MPGPPAGGVPPTVENIKKVKDQEGGWQHQVCGTAAQGLTPTPSEWMCCGDQTRKGEAWLDMNLNSADTSGKKLDGAFSKCPPGKPCSNCPTPGWICPAECFGGMNGCRLDPDPTSGATPCTSPEQGNWCNTCKVSVKDGVPDPDAATWVCPFGQYGSKEEEENGDFNGRCFASVPAGTDAAGSWCENAKPSPTPS